MKTGFASRLLATTICAAMIVTPAMARKAGTLTDLVGAKGAGGQTQLEERGFEHVRTEEGDSSKTSYWWHAGDKNCIRVVTYDGRYSSITDVSDSDCGHKSGGSGVAIAAAAIGAVALGALLLSRKGKNRNDGGYQQDWQQVEAYNLQSGRLRIFNNPSKNARVRGEVGEGILLRNYGCDQYEGESWCEVTTMDNRTRGWARDRYLRVSDTSAGHLPSYGSGSGELVEVYNLQSGTLKINSEPLKDSYVVGRVNSGTTLRRTGCQQSGGENWCHVTTLDGRMNGWARERYLRSSGSAGHYPSYGGGYAGSISGIEGMNGVEAFDELRSRGFENVDSFTSGNTLYGIYYYRPGGTCVQTTSANGRIVDIRDIGTHPRCR